jgi:regulatory protein
MPHITALRVASSRKQTVEIELDGKAWRIVDAEVVVRFALKAGDALEKDDLKRIEREDAYVTARRRAVNFCVTRPRTEREATRRLEEGRLESEIVQRVLADLREQGLLQDAEAAQLAARKGRRAGIGPRRVEADLRARGIAGETLDEAVESLRDPDWQRSEAAAIAAKRRSRLSGRPLPEQRRKIGDYLLRRGFDREIVSEVLTEVLGSEDDDQP